MLVCMTLKGFGQRHHNFNKQNKKGAQEVVDFLPQQRRGCTVLIVDVYQKWAVGPDVMTGQLEASGIRGNEDVMVWREMQTGCSVCVCA